MTVQKRYPNFENSKEKLNLTSYNCTDLLTQRAMDLTRIFLMSFVVHLCIFECGIDHQKSCPEHWHHIIAIKLKNCCSDESSFFHFQQRCFRRVLSSTTNHKWFLRCFNLFPSSPDCPHSHTGLRAISNIYTFQNYNLRCTCTAGWRRFHHRGTRICMSQNLEETCLWPN
jgi:hypothetical protein